MSDHNYDPDICRNIMVDVRYILFILDKYAKCERLIHEMKLVHPKKNQSNFKNTKKPENLGVLSFYFLINFNW